MSRIVVVGAGISGLSTAFALLEEAERQGSAGALDLQVLEAAPRAGGKIYSEPVDGFVCEWGPDGFLDNSPPTLEMCRALSLEERLVRASAEAGARRSLLLGGRLVQLPTSPPAFLSSEMLPLRGRLRVFLEPFIRPRRGELAAQDESVGDFARRRLGAQFARVLVDAMVTGIYGGNPDEISVGAAFPKLKKLEAEHGSLVRGALAMALQKRRERRAAARAAPGSAGGARDAANPPGGLQAGPSGVLTSLRGGLSELIETLCRRLGPERLRLDAKVEALVEQPDGRLAVQLDGRALAADQVVLSVPAHQARELAGSLQPELAAALGAFESAPIAVVCLGLRREQVRHPMNGFGFLVPGSEGLEMLGCLFSSSIYPGRAPAGHVLLRAMLGGRRHPQVVGEPDEALAQRALRILRPLLGIDGEPGMVRVVQHRRAIPQYTLGHLARVEALERLAGRWPGLHLTGNSFHGVGLNDCIRNGLELGRRLAGTLEPGVPDAGG